MAAHRRRPLDCGRPPVLPLPVYLHPFRPRLLDALRGYDRARFTADVGAGITVGIVALPLAMAFAIASGLKPEQGIITAIVGGLVVALLGGSNVQIGGPAGAFIVIVYGIVQRYGLTNLLISTALAGVLLFALGLFKLGALVRHIPVAIVIGFTQGIAVLIALSQLKDLFGLPIATMPADFFAQIGTLWAHAGQVNVHALVLGVACIAVLALWARLPRGVSARLPAPVVALAAATLVAWAFALPLETIGSRFGGIPSTLPTLALPAFSWESAKQLVTPTLTIALLGAVESLLCARIADNAAPTLPRHDPNQELMGQGVANMVSPLFGGMPVTGTIARTLTNVRAGATTPVAGVVHALALLAVVLLAAPLAVHVPLAALAGILLFVAWNMVEWHEFARLKRFSVPYRTILLGSFFLTVVFDLTVAVEVGLVLACLFFIYRMGTLFRAAPLAPADAPDGVQLYALYGSLFFGAVGKLEALAESLPAGTRAVVFDLHRLVSIDTSGLDALTQLKRTLDRQGVVLVLADLNDQPRSLIQRAGFDLELGEAGLAATPGQALERWRQAPS
jgi:SulP family sulfate permease